MAIFGGRSESFLKLTHPDLVRVHRLAIQNFDYMIIQAARTKEEQEADFNKGVSKAHWLESPHDYVLSYATDCAPLPLNWGSISSFYSMSRAILDAAKLLSVPVTWGGDFRTLKDRPHFELTNWRTMRNDPILVA